MAFTIRMKNKRQSILCFGLAYPPVNQARPIGTIGRPKEKRPPCSEVAWRIRVVRRFWWQSLRQRGVIVGVSLQQLPQYSFPRSGLSRFGNWCRTCKESVNSQQRRISAVKQVSYACFQSVSPTDGKRMRETCPWSVAVVSHQINV